MERGCQHLRQGPRFSGGAKSSTNEPLILIVLRYLRCAGGRKSDHENLSRRPPVHGSGARFQSPAKGRARGERSCRVASSGAHAKLMVTLTAFLLYYWMGCAMPTLSSPTWTAPIQNFGTSWECGYACACGVPTILFRTDTRARLDVALGPYNLMMWASATVRFDGPFGSIDELTAALLSSLHPVLLKTQVEQQRSRIPAARTIT